MQLQSSTCTRTSTNKLFVVAAVVILL